MKISLHHIMLRAFELRRVPDHEYSATLASILWLYYKSFSFLFVKLLGKRCPFRWKKPGLWMELVLIAENFQHLT